MKSKTIFILVVLSSVVIIITFDIIDEIIKDKNYKKQSNEAFDDLFDTERNQVFTLYQAIGDVIESEMFDKDHYQNLLKIATTTETICNQTFGKLSNLVETYGARLVYYATFYRDIKSALTRECGVNELQEIYTILGEIIFIYDDHPHCSTPDEKLKAVSQFYYSLSLRNEDWMQLCK